jgi:hypothetical protein
MPGFVLAAIFFVIIFFVFHKLVKITTYPGVLTYGEGVMTWMSWKLSNFSWPYGDILAVPSVYSCYGFLPSLVAAIGAQLLPPGPFPMGADLFWSGRVLTLVSWVGIGIFLAAIRQEKQWQRLMAAAVPLGIFSTGPFMFSWRVDPFLCLLLSAVMFFYSRKKEPVFWLSLAFAGAVALTKPTALIDFCYFAAFGIILSGREILYKRELLRLGVVVSGGVLVFGVFNLFSGGWMFNNIIAIQSMSGWKDLAGFDFGFKRFLDNPLIPLFLLGLFTAFVKGDARFALIAWLASLYTLCTFAKEGGAENYFLPVVIGVSPYLARIAGRSWVLKSVVVLTAVAFFVGDGLDSLGMRWVAKRQGDENRILKVIDFFQTQTVLSEDCMYPVMANREPIVSDIFQLGRVQSAAGGDILPWIRAAGGRVLGGGRMQWLCGQQPEGGIFVQVPGSEWVSYYPNFRCSWNPGGPHNGPWQIMRILLFYTLGFAAIGIALRRFFA